MIELRAAFAFFAAAVGGAVTCLVLLDLLRESGAGEGRWSDRWSFAPGALRGASYATLALASVGGLFLELLLIRWVSTEVRVFAYFKNFVLIACYLGFGLGCLLARRRVSMLLTAGPLLYLTLLVQLPWPDLRHVVDYLPLYFGAFSEVDVWGVPRVELSTASVVNLLAALVLVLPMFVLLCLSMVPFGQLVAWQVEHAARGIRGYTVNILGSLGGILLFSALAFWWLPPVAWFAVAAVVLALLVWPQPRLRWRVVAALAACAAITAIPVGDGAEVHWSPYQKLAIRPWGDAAYELTTNGALHQQILDLSPASVAARPDLELDRAIYDLPYRFTETPPRVLVLGSGMGNDVAAALRNGAAEVVAVEIDPLILELGRRLHFEEPYRSPRVEVVVDDARAYLERAARRAPGDFDVIVFALLDSHTTSSHFTNLRIDNYVYTVEAFRRAARLLAPDGVFVVKFWVNKPWIAGRVVSLVEEVFGEPPLHLRVASSYAGGQFFVAGSRPVIDAAIARDEYLGSLVATSGDLEVAPTEATRDDWPYFYQRAAGLPASVIILSALLVVVSALALQRAGARPRSLDGHFFLLGAGFLLLEVHVISRVALLFGTTWTVSSLIIAGVLLQIVLANLLVERFPRLPQWTGYAGLVVTLALSYLVPLERLFFSSQLARAVVPTALLSLPVLFAGIVFIQSFARARFSADALGSNLLGALLGGFLESVSLWTGIRSLLLVALALYLASWALRRRSLAALSTA